ncbi:MAG: diguanylate cyclase [Rhodoferax sp.]|nr:diguanylate cyclase [Rhodoferax sp.]
MNPLTTASRPRAMMRDPSEGSAPGGGFLVAVIVCGACLAGIITRPVGHLATVWLANAVLLGVLVRYPALATPSGWFGAAAGYVAAGLLMGDPARENLLLTIGNLVGVAVGYIAFQTCREEDRRLESQSSVLKMIGIIGLASTAAALVGAVIEPMVFGGRTVGGTAQWFMIEAVNYIAVLPVLLTIPDTFPVFRRRRWRPKAHATQTFLPLLALLGVSIWLAHEVSGPGVLSYPLIPLMWCALVYGLFATSLLTLLFTASMLLAISSGWIVINVSEDPAQTLASVRLGLALLAVCPLVVASVTAARTSLLKQVRYLAEHDPMTGASNRRSFLERAMDLHASSQLDRQASAFLIFDIDHFKAVNDQFGHLAGDVTIVQIARRVSDELDRKYRDRDNVAWGRLGGEEFGIFLARVDRAEIAQVAERIRATCESSAIELKDGRRAEVTVSIGYSWEALSQPNFETMMEAADSALYRAKNAGRNRVEHCENQVL